MQHTSAIAKKKLKPDKLQKLMVEMRGMMKNDKEELSGRKNNYRTKAKKTKKNTKVKSATVLTLTDRFFQKI